MGPRCRGSGGDESLGRLSLDSSPTATYGVVPHASSTEFQLFATELIIFFTLLIRQALVSLDGLAR